MNDKKNGKLHVLVIVLMISILAAAFVLFFLGITRWGLFYLEFLC